MMRRNESEKVKEKRSPTNVVGLVVDSFNFLILISILDRQYSHFDELEKVIKMKIKVDTLLKNNIEGIILKWSYQVQIMNKSPFGGKLVHWRGCLVNIVYNAY